jgi:hypothetical protein
MKKIILGIVTLSLVVSTLLFFAQPPQAPQTSLSTPTDFCSLQEAETKKILAQRTPDEVMANDENKDHFLTWKSLFTDINSISNDYFNQHIRIERAGDSLEDKRHFSVYSYYIVDWATIYIHDRFSKEKTLSDLQRMFAIKNPPTVDGLNYITPIRIRDELVDDLISCQDAVAELKKIRPGFEPNHVGFQRGEIVLFADDDSGVGGYCPYIELNLRNGTTLFSNPEAGCPQY